MITISQVDRVKNEEVLKRVGEKDSLLETTEERRNSMIGYLIRIPN